MPQSDSLNEPLTGLEIKQIIRQRLEAALNKNCTLANDIAYPGFEIDFEMRIKFLRAGTSSTLVWDQHKQGDTTFTGFDAIEDKISGSFACDAPDKARVEHELEVPVLVETPTGPKRRTVRFQKPEAYQQAQK
jgi:hypothetical protein